MIRKYWYVALYTALTFRADDFIRCTAVLHFRRSERKRDQRERQRKVERETTVKCRWRPKT